MSKECYICGQFLLYTEFVVEHFAKGKTSEELAAILPKTIDVCCRHVYLFNFNLRSLFQPQEISMIVQAVSTCDYLGNLILKDG